MQSRRSSNCWLSAADGCYHRLGQSLRKGNEYASAHQANYEPAEDGDGDGDGERILIDRLWPSDISKDDAHIQAWLKDIAPSAELRRWFSHDPKNGRRLERGEWNIPAPAEDKEAIPDIVIAPLISFDGFDHDANRTAFVDPCYRIISPLANALDRHALPIRSKADADGQFS